MESSLASPSSNALREGERGVVAEKAAIVGRIDGVLMPALDGVCAEMIGVVCRVGSTFANSLLSKPGGEGGGLEGGGPREGDSTRGERAGSGVPF